MSVDFAYYLLYNLNRIGDNMRDKKKGFTLVELIAVVAILGLIALIVYPAIGSVIRTARESSYEDQVAVIIKAAQSWSVDNAVTLPDDGSVYRLSVDTLVEEGYISNDEVIDPRDSSKTLDGTIEIQYDSSISQFTFNYVDSSSSSISVSDLGTTIINNSNSKSVLLANNGIYKGSDPDNYLKMNDQLWRILRSNEDGSITVISLEASSEEVWDESGNTNFDTSTIKTYLNSVFYTSLNSLSEFKTADFCTSYDGDTCQKSVTVSVGLLTTEDYLNASNNLKCVTGSEIECLDGNYLADFSKENGAEYMLDTSGSEVYIIDNGLISTSDTSQALNVRPVLTIDESVKLVGGTGTADNPYVISEV